MGAFRNPRTNSASRHRSEKRKKAFDSSSKVLSKLFEFVSCFSQVKIEVTRGHQRSKFPKINVFCQIIVHISKTMIDRTGRTLIFAHASFFFAYVHRFGILVSLRTQTILRMQFLAFLPPAYAKSLVFFCVLRRYSRALPCRREN